MSTAAGQLDRIEKTYRAHFGGHPRITRDPEALEGLRAELLAVPTSARADRERQSQLAEMLARELEAIRLAQADGPGALLAHRLTERANACVDRYRRHYAGRPRDTRDPGLLAEIIADLDAVMARMDRLIDIGETRVVDARNNARKNLALYRDEVRAIAKARAQGSKAEQGTRLATVANGQFALFRSHFVGHPRVSRSLTLLDRIRGTLEGMHGEMRALASAGLVNAPNDRNMELVARTLRTIEAERAAVIAAKEAVTPAILGGHLGEAANTIFRAFREHFAGQPRESRDLERLDLLIEGLWYIAADMEALDEADGDDDNSRNLQLVTDTLRRYRAEYAAIRVAQPR